MDIRERGFKTTTDHWTIVVDFFENYPQMVRRAFSNHSEDNSEIKKLWESLTAQLNSLGHGRKTVEKWQQAIGRWKSKVKSKASAFRSESLKTGGGPCMALPLNAIEDRLMNIYGWKSVEGVGNVELGFQKVKECKTVEKSHEKVHNKIILAPPLTFIENTVEVPPLIPFNEMRDENPSTSTIKTYQNDHAAKNTKKKSAKPRATQSLKSRRFVSISKMHSEQLDFLKSIDNKVGVMSSAVVEIQNDFKRLVDHMIQSRDSNQTNSIMQL